MANTWLRKGRDRYRFIYVINGFTERKSYFMSFGFSDDELERMLDGFSIQDDQNEYELYLVDEDEHTVDPYTLFTLDELINNIRN